jgi:hypothetical protein
MIALGDGTYGSSVWSETKLATTLSAPPAVIPAVPLITVPKGTGYAAIKGAKVNKKVATVDSISFAWTPPVKHTYTDKLVVEVWIPKKGKVPAELIATVTMTIGENGEVSNYVVAGLSQSDVLIQKESIVPKKGNLGYKYNVTITGLKASTKYSLQMQASQEISLSKMLKISASTAKFAAVSKVKSALSGESDVALTWNVPTGTKVASGAVYTIYEIYRVETNKALTFITETSGNASATVLWETLGIAKTLTTKCNFVIRAVIKDANGNVVNQSLEAKFSFKPSKL